MDREEHEKLSPTIEDFLAGLPPELHPPDPLSARGRILRASLALFAENGFDRTTTRAIAEKAEVNQAMVHYYFTSKELLYRRVLSIEIVSGIQAVIGSLRTDLPTREILVRLPLAILEEFRRNPVRTSLFRGELGLGGERLRQAVTEIGEFGPQGLRALLSTLATKAQEEREIRDLPARALLPFLISVAYGTLFLEPLFQVVLGISNEDPNVWEERVAAFETMLRHGLFAGERTP